MNWSNSIKQGLSFDDAMGLKLSPPKKYRQKDGRQEDGEGYLT